MSVRAYKIIEYARPESFNLWHDELLMDALEEKGLLGGVDEVGCISISEEDIKEIEEIMEKEKGRFSKEKVEESMESLEQIKKDVEKEGWATYICF